MSREYYMWCLVDRYLSMGNISYTEALEYARRDVYEIPKNQGNLESLASVCSLQNHKRANYPSHKAADRIRPAAT